MGIRKTFLAATLAVAVSSAPVFAQAASSTRAPAVTQVSRSGPDMSDESALRGGFIIPLIAIVAVILGIMAAVNDDDDDLPTSP